MTDFVRGAFFDSPEGRSKEVPKWVVGEFRGLGVQGVRVYGKYHNIFPMNPYKENLYGKCK